MERVISISDRPFKYLAWFVLGAFVLVAVSDALCLDNGDCEWSQVCCNHKCVHGPSCGTPSSECTSDFDCSSGEFCCSGKCKAGGCVPDTIFIAIGAVFGGFFIIVLILVCIRAATSRGRTVTAERTVITTTDDSPFDDQVPPSYQQGYPHPPPYHFRQPEIHYPPSYNPAGSTLDQPHPYVTASERRSGGVYAHRPSYGAVRSAPRFK